MEQRVASLRKSVRLANSKGNEIKDTKWWFKVAYSWKEGRNNRGRENLEYHKDTV